MKRFLISILAVIPFLTFAQSRPVDFGRQLELAKSDSQKAVIYLDALKYFYKKSPDSCLFYSNAGIEYFRKRGYKRGEGVIISQLSVIDQSEGRVNIALKRSHMALELYREANYKEGIGNELGNIGSIEGGKGNYEVAAKYIIESLKIGEEIGGKNALMIGYMNLGTIYMQQDDTANADFYMKKAVAISKDLPVSDKVISLYNIVAVLEAVKGNNEKALQGFMNNLELSSQNDFVVSHLECLSYLGQFYMENNDPEKALNFLHEGLKIVTDKKLPELKADMLLAIATIMLETEPAKALVYLDEALEISQALQNRGFVIMVQQSRIKCFKKLGNYSEALKATENKQKISDSIFSINKSIELSSIAATYELERSNERVKDLEVESSRNASQRNMMIVVVVIVALLLITLSVFYRRTIKLNKQLKLHQAELNELNAMKDKLFSIIGHDLRGPMARIPTILDIYEDPGTDSDEKAYLLQSLREHTKASMDMLEKLLFWGQALVKGIRIQMQRINLNEIVNQNVSLYAPAIAEKGVSVVNKLPADIFAYADPTHVDFILRNLLTNAMKYSHPGGEIAVSSVVSKKPGFLVISVKDNGTGIKPEMLPRIFNPAYSVPGTADEKGTGIGLMLCKEFAILDGGDIWVESEYGKGATFFLSLKAAS